MGALLLYERLIGPPRYLLICPAGTGMHGHEGGNYDDGWGGKARDATLRLYNKRAEAACCLTKGCALVLRRERSALECLVVCLLVGFLFLLSSFFFFFNFLSLSYRMQQTFNWLRELICVVGTHVHVD